MLLFIDYIGRQVYFLEQNLNLFHGSKTFLLIITTDGNLNQCTQGYYAPDHFEQCA